MAAPEWAIWEAQAGHVTLPDGERVLVRGGDQVLLEETDAGLVVLDHKPATRN